MALIEGCKHELEITIPVEEVEQESEKVAEDIRAKAKMPGFRPGKVPMSMIRQRYGSSIRQEALENLLPKFFRKRIEEEHLHVVSSFNVKDLEFEAGKPVTFKAEFEVAPEVELGEYRGISVPYAQPAVTDEDVNERLEALRKRKADYANLDPRPAEMGDVVVVDLHSVSGLEGEPMHAHDLQVELGSPETLPDFNDHLVGLTPGDEANITVTYPEEYAQERLAGKTVEFHVDVKQLQRKELPELNDEFAKDLGDFQTIEELKETIRNNTLRERETAAQRQAKDAIAEKLADTHNFPVPEAFIDRQVDLYIERFLSEHAAQGMDPKKIPVNREKVKEAMRDRAIKEIKTSLLLEKVADTESIVTTKDEVDAEVQRFARQEREPVAAVRRRFEDNGTLGRIAHAIRTEKTLNFLFEHARKEAPAEPAAEESAE
ncbi:MAG: trigger factor [Bryobacterales bacterium]|nr:trigger factor [Bryobacterales bacterium]